MPLKRKCNQPLNPYFVNHVDDNVYIFQTDFNVTYSTAFTNVISYFPPVVGVYDIEVYDFLFYPENYEKKSRKIKDQRVHDTVIDLVLSYFDHNRKILIYFCDSSDGADAGRQKLFKDWYKVMADTLEHYPLTINLDDTAFYGGILTRHDFPEKGILQYEVIDNAHTIISSKFGY